MFLEIGSFFLAGILYLNNMCTLSVSVALLSISSDIYNPLTQIVSSALEMRSYRDVLTKIEKIPNPSTSATEEKQLENNASEAAERRKSELLEQGADAKAALAE